MARIPMTSGFQVLPEGTHVLRVYEVNYKEDYGKLEIKMITAEGITHMEKFSLMGSNGKANEGAMNAFSYFAKNVMNDFTMEDIDPDDMKNHYVKARCEHDIKPHRDDPNKTVTFAHLKDYEPASGFETKATEKAMTLGNENSAPAVDASSMSLADMLA